VLPFAPRDEGALRGRGAFWLPRAVGLALAPARREESGLWLRPGATERADDPRALAGLFAALGAARARNLARPLDDADRAASVAQPDVEAARTLRALGYTR